jgi:hypothetical protein
MIYEPFINTFIFLCLEIKEGKCTNKKFFKKLILQSVNSLN